MSESDDTDVLLLIPPDLFLVPSSDSDESDFHERAGYGGGGPGVVSELVEHMQSLESRISAIESKDNSLDVSLLNNSIDSQIRTPYYTPLKHKQSLARNKLSTSQTPSLQNTPIKNRQALSVPSTPSSYQPSNRTNPTRNDVKLARRTFASGDTNPINATSQPWNKHAELTSFSEPCILSSVPRSAGFPHAIAVTPEKEICLAMQHDNDSRESNSCAKPYDQYDSLTSTPNLHQKPIGRYQLDPKSVKDMKLSEVDELLHEMEATETELAKRISNAGSHQFLHGRNHQLETIHSVGDAEMNEWEMPQRRQSSPLRKLDLQIGNADGKNQTSAILSTYDKSADAYPDLSLPEDDSLQLSDMEKVVSEFRTWQPSTPQKKAEHAGIDASDTNNVRKGLEESTDQPTVLFRASQSASTASEPKHSCVNPVCEGKDNAPVISPSDTSNLDIAPRTVGESAKSHLSIHQKQSDIATELLPQSCRNPYHASNLQSTVHEMHATNSLRNTSHAATNTEPCLRMSQRLFTLSDFWDNSTSKSQEEMLRMKLEEEKFRREHCEHLIQELQKRLLEQQEKVAVAIRVDNEKNVAISQFQNAWSKLKLRCQVLETEHQDLQNTLKNITERHQSETSEFQFQIKRFEDELSKALDLAAGYKEKSDTVVKEKLDLLKNHADELENYKSLVQEAEKRYDQMKGERTKVYEKSQKLEEALKTAQQELNRERLRGGEVKSEMALIHKALDACEAELTVLRQEKENLQLKVKEETHRNSILEQNKASLQATIENLKTAERIAKDETQSLTEQQEKAKVELREVYQKQVDEVVKAKLQEFQSQLDAAETAFQAELETRQRAIAECAARKIKSVIDKHQLEINLLEEKHREEKRLCGIQLAQSMQQTSMLEAQLNTQRATKAHLAEQLHSVMQEQWQQALHIISGGNTENLTPLQKISAEKFFEIKNPKTYDSIANCCNKAYQEQMKLESQSMPSMDIHTFTNIQSRGDRNDGAVTPEETPLTSRKGSKDDLRRYIKMILDMQQQKETFSKPRFSENSPSPTPVCREVPRKHYMKKEENMFSEESILWQPASEVSIPDMTEYVPVSQKMTPKADQQKIKPPWK